MTLFEKLPWKPLCCRVLASVCAMLTDMENAGIFGWKKTFSILTLGTLLSISLVVTTEEAFAVSDPTAFTVDCDSGTTLSDSTVITGLDTNRVITGVVGDTFTVTNGAAADAGDCTVAPGSAVTTAGDATTIADGNGTLVFTIAVGGSFTIAGDGGSPVSFFVDACSLTGSGVEADPWRVSSQADFHNVGLESSTDGQNSCSLDGHYLQTQDLTGTEGLDDYSNDVVGSTAAPFTGVYDGAHFRISLGANTSTASLGWNYDSNGDSAGGYSSREALFLAVNGGTIQRVRLSGEMRSSSTDVSGLVRNLYGGGLISEVSSTVSINVDDSNAIIGGLVSIMGDDGDDGDFPADQDGFDDDAARIQYSKYAGSIDWTDSGGSIEGPTIGGLVGQTWGTGLLEIRDSYAQARISYDSGVMTDALSAVHAGGILGSDGYTKLAIEDPSVRSDLNADVHLIRTYAAGSFQNTCSTSCRLDQVFTGGLVGYSSTNDSDDAYVSNFWLTSAGSQAIGDIDTGSQPAAYDGNSEPVAVPLSASRLEQIASFTTEEDGSTDLPGGTAMASDATTDYRWAIEAISASTFVPSNYDQDGDTGGTAAEISDYTNRVVYSNTDTSKEYRTQRAGVNLTTAHGGSDPAEVTGYPALGRVWDICDEYPTLVWEERNSCSGSGGGSDSSPSAADLASAAGLTEAEYAEFLASGLTLEQFKAARLAATGPDGALLMGGGSLALLFSAAGLIILVALGRERRLRRS